MARETSQDRRQRIAKMQAQQKAADRRRLMLVVGACALVLLLIVGSVAWVILGEKRKTDKAVESISGDVTSAKCDAITTDKASGSLEHVGPGTAKADVSRVDYDLVPPSSGEHFATPAVGDRHVYKVADAPPVETLVHNLEHGYTILWYDASVEQSMAQSFEVLSERVNKLKEAGNKFIVVPWDASRGKFPDGKKFVLSHWAADPANPSDAAKQAGHRQFCGGVSLKVVEDFVKKYPWSMTPEPGAA